MRCESVELDLAEPDAAGQLFDRAEQAFGPVDILVNNAVLDVISPVESLNTDNLDRHHAVNFRAAAPLCTEFHRRFRGPSGRIINLTSRQGLAAMPENTAYAATEGLLKR